MTPLQRDFFLYASHIPGMAGQRLHELRLYLSDIHEPVLNAEKLKRELHWPTSLVQRLFDAWNQGTYKPSIEKCRQEQIDLITCEDDFYPTELHSLDDKPATLFLRGQLPKIPYIAIVGSRKATNYGKEVIRKILEPFEGYGIGIISGLALGIDGLAHSIALDLRIPTVAVLGTGIDDKTIYPREHFALAKRILDEGGALLSEYPPGSPSRKEHFPQRNRIISGMSIATVVVEAGIDSGSLITARMALEQHREVLAVPGPIWSHTSKGCHQLIKAGAQLCESSQDIIQAINLERPKIMEQTRKEMPLTSTEQSIYSAIQQPVDIDTLQQLTHFSAPSLVSSLSLLELKGYIKQEKGLYRRTIERVTK